MGFAGAAQTCFGGGQFGFGGLQLRGTGGSGFGCLIGGAFRFTDGFARFHKRRSGSIAPRRQRGFAFNQPRIFCRDARARGLGILSQGLGMREVLAEFSQARFSGFKRGPGAAFLGLHAFRFNAAAFKRGARGGFIGARRIKPLFGFMQGNRRRFGFLFCRAGGAACG
jgi:hypothetical protein